MAADQKEDAAGSSAKQGNQQDSMIDTSLVSRSAQKVELDLEDAPFLEEEEEVQPEPPRPAEAIPTEAPQEDKPPPPGRKKLIIIAAAALVVLVAAALTAKFLFFKGKPATTPETAGHSAPKEPAADNASAAKAPELPDIHVRLEPFWVEQKGTGEEIRFLIVRILLGTTDKMVAKEFENKLLPARNAIFYYLKNKDVQFLADEHNAEKLRSELLLVINQYVTDGKFDTLMFEEYVVK